MNGRSGARYWKQAKDTKCMFSNKRVAIIFAFKSSFSLLKQIKSASTKMSGTFFPRDKVIQTAVPVDQAKSLLFAGAIEGVREAITNSAEISSRLSHPATTSPGRSHW